MPMSRSLKNVMRSAKSPKSGTTAIGDGMKDVKRAGKQFTQTGNKSNPKSQSGKNDYDGDEVKMIV